MHAPCKFLAIGGALTAVSLFPASALAEVTQWDHNGSLMRLEQTEKKVRLVYAQPRDGLGQAGVKQGTVLFDGELKSDGRFAGYAKLFRKGCDPVDYFVEGSRDSNKGEILLQGQVPVYASAGCKITGYTDEGSASSLKFTLAGPMGGQYAGGDLPEAAQERPGYLPPPSIGGGEPDADADTDTARSEPRAPAQRAPRERGPSYADPRPDERAYADRRDRYDSDRRYDGGYAPPSRYYEDYDADDEDDYDDEPAYVPYQPWWRGY